VPRGPLLVASLLGSPQLRFQVHLCGREPLYGDGVAGNPLDGDGTVVQRFQGVAGFCDGDGRFLVWSWVEVFYSHSGCLVVREDPHIASIACGLAVAQVVCCCFSDVVQLCAVHLHLVSQVELLIAAGGVDIESCSNLGLSRRCG